MTADYTLLHGDCLALLPTLDACSIDACVTDPPYELGFMSRHWDRSGVAFQPDTWAAVLRVMKPGAYLLAAGGTRTYHRMVCAIEDAGFIVKDCLMWLYASGFPKSHDISKALDRIAGAEREVVGRYQPPNGKAWNLENEQERNGETWEMLPKRDLNITAPATDLARQWSGYGTALKPAYEPLVLAQKPLDGTYAANVAEWGCGALNIDGCRIGTSDDMNPRDFDDSRRTAPKFSGILNGGKEGQYLSRSGIVPSGRWPANILLDEAAAAELDAMSGERPSRGEYTSSQDKPQTPRQLFGTPSGTANRNNDYAGQTGGASRFFYVAKASRSEREQGLADYARRNVNDGRQSSIDNPYQRGDTLRANTHPTVKPTALMRYLVRLVTPPNGLVLDPFMGSGSTGVACMDERRRFVGIEMEAEYIEIARSRIETAAAVPYQETLL